MAVVDLQVEDAEHFLDMIADDVPLFTNTREGVFSREAAPAPLEAPSDLFILRPEARQRWNGATAAPGASGAAPPQRLQHTGSVAKRAAMFEAGEALGPAHQRPVYEGYGQGTGGGGGGSSKSLADEQRAQPLLIPDLQVEVAGLQDDELDISHVAAPAPAPPPPAPAPRGGRLSEGELPDPIMAELAHGRGESTEVSSSVLKGLVQLMVGGAPEKRRKAAIAMCNLCCESVTNRANAGAAGAVPVLVAMMQEGAEDEHLRRLATACVCNLSADPPLKTALCSAGAIPHLSRLLVVPQGGAQERDSRAATAHAAATLWSLCVDMDHIKPLVAQPETLAALLELLRSGDAFVRGQACGCIGEVCIGQRPIKGRLVEMGVIGLLVSVLRENEPSIQRLAASALCNLSANHADNKQLCRKAGLIDAFIALLTSADDEAVLSAAAGGLYNLVQPVDLARLRESGALQVLRSLPISQNINVRLGIAP